jgi:hypothetical protein
VSATDIITEVGELTDISSLSAIGVAVASRIAVLAQQGNGNGQPPEAEADRLLSTKEAAARLGVSTSFLYTGRGKHIPYEKRGLRKRLYRESALQHYEKRNHSA